jgi:anti-sigma B factor antagonist
MREFKMNIKTIENDNLINISVSGSADSAGIRKFIELVDSICDGEDKDVDLDLSELEYMDSTCISVLLKLHKVQKQKNKDFRISKASYKVSSLLSLCSLSDTLMK